MDRYERQRLQALHSLDVAGKRADAALDQITQLASVLLKTRFASITLVDADRAFTKAMRGLPDGSVKRKDSIAAKFLTARETVVIEDLSADPRFCSNPYVTAAPNLRFYAAAPLVTVDGFPLGVLSVFDNCPRDVDSIDNAILEQLASLAMSHMQLRRTFGQIDPVTGLRNRARFLTDIETLEEGEYDCLVIDMSEPGQMRQLVRLLDARELEARMREWSKCLSELLPLRARLYHLALTLFAAIIPAGTGEPGAIFREFASTTFPDGRYLAPMAYGGAVRFASGTPSADVLRMALAAGYEGVEAPRRFGRYEPVSEEQRRRSGVIVTELQVALRTGEGLRLVYQPRLHAQTMRCTSVEALLRWEHATLGSIPPGEFIPLAQQAALSRALTNRVIDLAVTDFDVWGGAKGPGRISLNIFPTDLRDPDFHTRLLRNLKAHGVAPAAVELELTELSRVDSEDATTRAQLDALLAAGIELAIDDFGTGYSNLAAVGSLPARIVKLDQSFVRTVATQRRNQAVVKATVNLAHELGYRVVAEGIEDATTAQEIRRYGCDELQGYFFAHPLEAGELLAYFEA